MSSYLLAKDHLMIEEEGHPYLGLFALRYRVNIPGVDELTAPDKDIIALRSEERRSNFGLMKLQTFIATRTSQLNYHITKNRFNADYLHKKVSKLEASLQNVTNLPVNDSGLPK